MLQSLYSLTNICTLPRSKVMSIQHQLQSDDTWCSCVFLTFAAHYSANETLKTEINTKFRCDIGILIYKKSK